jgi:hypothetical protein
VKFLSHLRRGNSCVSFPDTANWLVTQSAPRGLRDYAVTAPQSLGFPFPAAIGNVTSDVFICEYSFVRVDAVGILEFTPAVNGLLTQGAPIFRTA